MNRRRCFQETLSESPDYYRRMWLQVAEDIGYSNWNLGKTVAEWRKEWSILRNSRSYEHDLGDLVLPAIAHCIQKDILIFITTAIIQVPVYVIQASSFAGRSANTEIPLCLAYNQYHYEALFPNTEEDVIKSIELKRDVITGKYHAKEYLVSGDHGVMQQVERLSEDVLSTEIIWDEKEIKCKKMRSNIESLSARLNLEKLDELKKIKKKERNKEQNELYKVLMKQQRTEKDRQRKAAVRRNYTADERNKINEKRRKKQVTLPVKKKEAMRIAILRRNQSA